MGRIINTSNWIVVSSAACLPLLWHQPVAVDCARIDGWVRSDQPRATNSIVWNEWHAWQLSSILFERTRRWNVICGRFWYHWTVQWCRYWRKSSCLGVAEGGGVVEKWLYYATRNVRRNQCKIESVRIVAWVHFERKLLTFVQPKVGD